MKKRRKKYSAVLCRTCTYITYREGLQGFQPVGPERHRGYGMTYRGYGRGLYRVVPGCDERGVSVAVTDARPYTYTYTYSTAYTTSKTKTKTKNCTTATAAAVACHYCEVWWATLSVFRPCVGCLLRAPSRGVGGV